MKKNLAALSVVLAAAFVFAGPARAQIDDAPPAADAPYEASAYIDPAHVMVGDMIVDVAAEAPAGTTEAGFALKGTPLWPGGVIPLVFSPQYTPQEKAMVFAACAQWSRRANVRCVERTNEARFASVIKDPNAAACYAHLGYNPWGGQMSLNLGPAYCWEQPGGRIMHELGHLLGLRHEQTRPDRDQFITMRWENMAADASSRLQYEKVTGQPRASQYDFESIMHYGPAQCGSQGRPAFTVNAGYEKFARAVGQRKGLSKLDGEVMASLYGAPGASSDLVAADAADDKAPELVADAAAEPAADAVTVGQQLYAEEDADKASADQTSLRELPLLAWTLELVTDAQYKSWRDGLKPSAEAAKFLKPARTEALNESYATLARAALNKSSACAAADAFLKERPGAGQSSLDPKDFPLGRWRQDLWKKTAHGSVKSKASLAMAVSHRKAAGLWSDGKLCEAAAIYAKLAPRKPAAAPVAARPKPQTRVSPFGARRDILLILLRVFSGANADRLYSRFYGQSVIFAKMDAVCRTRYSARGKFLQSTSLSLAAFEYRECIQSGADAPLKNTATAAIERLRKDDAAPLLLDPYLQSPRACVTTMKDSDVAGAGAGSDADADAADRAAAKTTAADARIRRWLKMTDGVSRFSQKDDLKAKDRVRAHCSLALGYERLAAMYAGLGAAGAKDADAGAVADEDPAADVSDDQAVDALDKAAAEEAPERK